MKLGPGPKSRYEGNANFHRPEHSDAERVISTCPGVREPTVSPTVAHFSSTDARIVPSCSNRRSARVEVERARDATPRSVLRFRRETKNGRRGYRDRSSWKGARKIDQRHRIGATGGVRTLVRDDRDPTRPFRILEPSLIKIEIRFAVSSLAVRARRGNKYDARERYV